MKAKNPLYVVTKEGNVVEEAVNMFDALVKKLEIEPFVELIKNILLDKIGKEYFVQGILEFSNAKMDESVKGKKKFNSLTLAAHSPSLYHLSL